MYKIKFENQSVHGRIPMKQMRWILVLYVLIVMLAAACQPAMEQNEPQTQPEEPGKTVEEPQDGAYPGPVEVEPVESGPEVVSDGTEAPGAGEEQAYPEPNPVAPVEMLPFEIATQHEYSPVAGDASLDQGNVFINESGIILMESFPVQVKLALSGELPTPCNHLRAVVSPPDANNEIQVAVYSVIDPETMCTQVLAPFDVTIPIGNFTSGSYRVMVNGEPVGTIELP